MASSPPDSSQASTRSSLDANNHPPSRRTQSDPVAADEKGVGSSFSRFLRRRKTTHLSLQDWDHNVTPYHDYVRQLVAAGWTNLQDLDIYMSTAATRDNGLIVSVLDILADSTRKDWPQLYNELDLKKFINDHQNRDGAKVRFYMGQYDGTPSPALIETLGSALNLDPRFFEWILHTRGHIFTPSQRHNAPYLALGFGVLKDQTEGMTDAERFKVLVYIQPDENGSGWTGVILFPSNSKHNVSAQILVPPPSFKSPRPPPITLKPKSIRELYLESFDHIDLAEVTISPFYALSYLLRINCFCWNQIITAIREEDRRINGISDTSIGHAEEIKTLFGIVQRGGSYGWAGREEQAAKQSQTALEEDFKHLVDQMDLLWTTRNKLAAMRQSRSEARWTALTNAFTYLFAPITIMTGVYGMNVSQITGTDVNPNIWQFFVAVAAMNVLMLATLSLYNFVAVYLKHGKRSGWKEVVGFAVGKTGYTDAPPRTTK